MANELLKFEDGTLGLALNLEEREIGAIVLGEFSGIEEGQPVQRTGEVLSVGVGEGYLGRVVDPLGNPIDGLGEIATDSRRASSCRPLASWSASRCTSRCRPATRPSTPWCRSAAASVS